MAIGARKAFSELSDGNERSLWLSLPHVGCDGVPETGQQYVRRGQMAATVVYPTVAGIALEMYLNAKPTKAPVADRTLAQPTSFPPVESLRPMAPIAH
jgi:ribose transport system substrate-binding protein